MTHQRQQLLNNSDRILENIHSKLQKTPYSAASLSVNNVRKTISLAKLKDKEKIAKALVEDTLKKLEMFDISRENKNQILQIIADKFNSINS